jgi:alkylated DNA nucleotide flippase Atl1
VGLPPVIFPDIELFTTTYLRAALAARPEPVTTGVYVSNKVPTTRRDRMVIVRRDGGFRVSAVLDAARVSVQVFGKTDQEATDLARLVRALLHNATTDSTAPVTRVVDQSGPSPVADESGQPLMFLVVELYTRGSALTNQ